jgi:hypothetical protein
MAQAQRPEELEFDYETAPLKLEGHEDYFSVYWSSTRFSADEFLGLSDSFEFSDSSAASIATEERQQTEDITYEVVKAIAAEETPRFIRVDSETEGIALTWTVPEPTREIQIIGVIAEQGNSEFVHDIYQSTTTETIPNEDLEKIDEFINSHQG